MTVFVQTADVTNTNNNSQIVNLAANDDLIVGREATLVTTGANSVVVRASNSTDMLINGELLSAGICISSTAGGHDISVGLDGLIASLNDFRAIDLGDGAGNNRIANAGEIRGGSDALFINGSGNQITNSGIMSGVSGFGLGIFVGANNRVTNHGLIESLNSAGISIGTISGGGGNVIVNTGVINGLTNGIQFNDDNGVSTNRLTNSGTISTSSASGFAYLGGDPDDIVVNTGLMTGNVSLGDGSDRFDTRLGTIAGEVLGGDGGDDLLGSAFDDVFKGGNGSDDLLGFAGNDTLDGGSDADTLTGGLGADDLIGGAGSDTASYARAGGKVTASLADESVNTGEAAGDSYNGIEGLLGSSFADTLTGDAGFNSIEGGRGNDRINGGGGAAGDLLDGGSGKDMFVFDSEILGFATIANFVVQDDQFELDSAIFTGLAVGDLAVGAFRNGGAALDASDRIIYNKPTGELFYDEDGVGGVAQVKFADLASNIALKFTDFVVV